MEIKEQLYEGKAKKVFATDDPDLCVVSYKDDATAFNGKKKGTIVGKGVVNNRMSNFMFKMLEENGIHTHYVEELNDRDTVVKKVEIVPLEVIVRNRAAGSQRSMAFLKVLTLLLLFLNLTIRVILWMTHWLITIIFLLLA